MMFETSPIRLWTGRLFVWVYCTRPKMTPTAQITRPVQRMAWPESEPLKKLTFERSGIWMSASPAEAAAALKIKRTELHHTLFFPIRVAFNAKSFSRLTIQNNHKNFGVFYLAGETPNTRTRGITSDHNIDSDTTVGYSCSR